MLWQAIMVGKPECTRHILDHYADELKGLPPGVKGYLDMDGCKGSTCLCGFEPRRFVVARC